jgi:hypothetical protein
MVASLACGVEIKVTKKLNLLQENQDFETACTKVRHWTVCVVTSADNLPYRQIIPYPYDTI